MCSLSGMSMTELMVILILAGVMLLEGLILWLIPSAAACLIEPITCMTNRLKSISTSFGLLKWKKSTTVVTRHQKFPAFRTV